MSNVLTLKYFIKRYNFFTVSDNISVKYHHASEVIIIVTSFIFTEGECLKRNSWKHFLIKPKDLICHPTPGWSRHQQQADCQKSFEGTRITISPLTQCRVRESLGYVLG